MRRFRRRICAAMAAMFIAAAVTPSAMAAYELAANADGEGNGRDEQAIQAEQSVKELMAELSSSQQKLRSAFDTMGEIDSPAEVEVIVDGRNADTDYLAFILNEVTYAPLRALCEALGADSVDYDGESGNVSVTADGLEMSFNIGDTFLTANGRYLYVPDGFVMKEGRLMAPLRTLCRVFGASLEWNEEDAAAIILSGGTPILSGDEFYDENDVYWMTQIIHAEAGVEPFLGKIAVGNVIMNRIASDEFPDSVYDVVFDHKCGVQFTPTIDGSVYYKVDDYGCEEAAKLALEGTDVVGDSLYFATATISCWAKRNRPYVTQIGTHAFWL